MINIKKKYINVKKSTETIRGFFLFSKKNPYSFYKKITGASHQTYKHLSSSRGLFD